MAAPELKLAANPVVGMDRQIRQNPWSPRRWPIGAKVGAAAILIVVVVLLAVKLIAGVGVRTLRVPFEQVTIATVERGVFHDLIPLRANVVPRETIYVDAIDGGRVDRVLVEAGDMVQEGQPLIELSNTNLALQIIQEESQLNQAISQLQQNEIALEQNQLSNDRAIAEIDYNLVRLGRSAERREELAAKGAVPAEQRDIVTDELAHFKRLRPIQVESGQRQSELRERLLPDIHRQLKILKVGENRAPGQRLAEVTPDTGMKLIADVDEFYLARVRAGQTATVILDGKSINLTVRRVSPQVHNGQFRIDLDFDGASPTALVEGSAAQGRLHLGGDTPAMVLPVGTFLERTGADWVFVVALDARSAERRRIKVGRRTSEQLEVLSGLATGERVITSDYTGLDRVDRIVLTH
jgi:HlyD family secretion protein